MFGCSQLPLARMVFRLYQRARGRGLAAEALPVGFEQVLRRTIETAALIGQVN